MSVEEYDRQFTSLARYAAHPVLDERFWIRRFVLSLRDPFCHNMSSQLELYSTYTMAVDATLVAEIVEKGECNQNNKRRRDYEGKSFGKSGFAGGSRSFRGNQYSSRAPSATVQSSASNSRQKSESKGS